MSNSLFFRYNDDWANVISLQGKSIHRIYKSSKYYLLVSVVWYLVTLVSTYKDLISFSQT